MRHYKLDKCQFTEVIPNAIPKDWKMYVVDNNTTIYYNPYAYGHRILNEWAIYLAKGEIELYGPIFIGSRWTSDRLAATCQSWPELPESCRRMRLDP